MRSNRVDSVENLNKTKRNTLSSTSKFRQRQRQLNWTSDTEKETFHTVVINYKLPQNKSLPLQQQEIASDHTTNSLNQTGMHSKMLRNTWRKELAKMNAATAEENTDKDQKITTGILPIEAESDLNLNKLYGESSNDSSEEFLVGQHRNEEEKNEGITSNEVVKSVNEDTPINRRQSLNEEKSIDEENCTEIEKRAKEEDHVFEEAPMNDEKKTINEGKFFHEKVHANEEQFTRKEERIIEEKSLPENKSFSSEGPTNEGKLINKEKINVAVDDNNVNQVKDIDELITKNEDKTVCEKDIKNEITHTDDVKSIMNIVEFFDHVNFTQSKPGINVNSSKLKSGNKAQSIRKDDVFIIISSNDDDDNNDNTSNSKNNNDKNNSENTNKDTVEDSKKTSTPKRRKPLNKRAYKTKTTSTSHHSMVDKMLPVDSMEDFEAQFKSNNQGSVENTSSQQLATTTHSVNSLKQRRLELHRYRIAVEQKRLDLLELKMARERDEMFREQMLFEKQMEKHQWQIRPSKDIYELEQ